MKTQLDSLTAFFMQNVPERAGRGFDSQIDGMKVISAARDVGNGQYRLSVLRYTALLSWERFPFRLVDPQLLVALLEVWMDEHAAPVLEETGIENTEADWDVTLEDEETATVVLSIPLADELVIWSAKAAVSILSPVARAMWPGCVRSWPRMKTSPFPQSQLRSGWM